MRDVVVKSRRARCAMIRIIYLGLGIWHLSCPTNFKLLKCSVMNDASCVLNADA